MISSALLVLLPRSFAPPFWPRHGNPMPMNVKTHCCCRKQRPRMQSSSAASLRHMNAACCRNMPTCQDWGPGFKSLRPVQISTKISLLKRSFGAVLCFSAHRVSAGEALGKQHQVAVSAGNIWHGRYGQFTPLGATSIPCRGYVPAKRTHGTECLRPSRDGHTDEIGLRDHHRSELPVATRIGRASRSESGSRTNPCAA